MADRSSSPAAAGRCWRRSWSQSAAPFCGSSSTLSCQSLLTLTGWASAAQPSFYGSTFASRRGESIVPALTRRKVAEKVEHDKPTSRCDSERVLGESQAADRGGGRDGTEETWSHGIPQPDGAVI